MEAQKASNRRLAHNKAVQNNTQKAGMDYDSAFGTSFQASTGHIDGVSQTDAREYISEHSDEMESVIDQFKVDRDGGDGIGYLEVNDGEIIGHTVYANYQQ